MASSFITLEEHFLCPDIAPHSVYAADSPLFARLLPRLHDFENDRIKTMDAHGVRTQVLSHVPAYDRDWTPDECVTINNYLHRQCERFPGRYLGFATLPMHDPEAAVAELERCVRTLGFVGSLVDNTTVDGTFYDARRFRPVFAKHVELDVPIYIHPTYAGPAASEAMFKGEGINQVASIMIGGPGFGWHAGVGIHILRLFAVGIFDEFPKLKVIIGHDGELLPFNLSRTARMPASAWGVTREFMDVWNENIWVTTSGMFVLGPLQCLLEVTKPERVMFSIDYPFSGNELGEAFMEKLRASGIVTPEQWEGIAKGNVQKLLKIDA